MAARAIQRDCRRRWVRSIYNRDDRIADNRHRLFVYYETDVGIVGDGVYRISDNYVEFYYYRSADGKVGKRKARLRIVRRVGRSVDFHASRCECRTCRDWVGEDQLSLFKRTGIGDYRSIVQGVALLGESLIHTLYVGKSIGYN